jgi:hypothetical protein
VNHDLTLEDVDDPVGLWMSMQRGGLAPGHGDTASPSPAARMSGTVVLTPCADFPIASSSLPDDAPEDAATRLDLLLDALAHSIIENEAQQRAMLCLTLVIRSAIGIEVLLWLTDVAGLSRHDATELMGWSTRAVLRSALTDNTRRAA